MSEQQRKCVWPLSFRDHDVQGLPAELGTKLTQPVKPVLKAGVIKLAPVVEEAPQPTDRNALLPAGPEVGREPRLWQASRQVHQRTMRQLEPLLAHVYLGVATHARHGGADGGSTGPFPAPIE